MTDVSIERQEKDEQAGNWKKHFHNLLIGSATGILISLVVVIVVILGGSADWPAVTIYIMSGLLGCTLGWLAGLSFKKSWVVIVGGGIGGVMGILVFLFIQFNCFFDSYPFYCPYFY